MLEIRTYQDEDKGEVKRMFARGLEVHIRAMPRFLPGFIERALREDLDDIPGCYLAEEGCHFWVADLDGTVKGMAGIQRHSDEEAELRRVSVEGDTRRLGIGSKLMETAENFCREQGYRRIRLTTVTRSAAAVSMYRKYGYELTGAEQLGPVSAWVFVKELGDRAG